MIKYKFQNPQCFYNHFFKGISLLFIRVFIFYEFFDSGMNKWRGSNWFSETLDKFPFPFNFLSEEINWNMVMYSELIFSVLVLSGVFTRFSALILMFIVFVAWYAVHAGYGYNVCNNGFKLSLIYIIMLFSLLINGGGILSLDVFLRKMLAK